MMAFYRDLSISENSNLSTADVKPSPVGLILDRAYGIHLVAPGHCLVKHLTVSLAMIRTFVSQQ